MADIAEIGFRADTSELVDAKKKLDDLKPAAENAEAASEKLANSVSKNNGAFAKVTSGASSLGKTLKGLGPLLLGVAAGFAAAFTGGAILTALSATADRIDNITKAARKLGATTAEMQALGAAADMAGVDFGGLVSAGTRTTVAMAKAERAGKGAEGVYKLLGTTAGALLKMPIGERFAFIADKLKSLGATSDDLLPILAQLGDRQGALVALFEGGGDQIRFAADMMERFGGTITDLQASKVEEMNDAFTSIGYAIQAVGTQLVAAFAPFLGPIFTAIAEGIGFISTGIASLLAGTSSLLPIIQETAIALGIMFAPFIIAGLWSLYAGVIALTASIAVGLIQAVYSAIAAFAAFAMLNPFTAIVLAIGAALAAVYVFRDGIKSALGVDVANAAKVGINAIIGGFVGGFDAIAIVWGALPGMIGEAAIGAANLAIKAINAMVNGAKAAINGLIGLLNQIPGVALGGIAGEGTNAVPELENPYAGATEGLGGQVVGALAKGQSIDYLGELQTKLQNATADLKITGETAGSAASAGFNGLGDAANGAGGAAEGAGAKAAAAAKEMTELQKIAAEINKTMEPFDQATQAYNAAKDALEAGVMTNDAYAASVARIQEAFIAAGGTTAQWSKVITDNTDSVGKSMKDLAENSLSKLGDEFINLAVDGKANFADLAKSLIKDMLKIAWQALVVKPLLGMFGFSGGGSFGGGGFSVTPGAGLFAKGGVFEFASGGASTNTVLNNPTAFAFANGGALGGMGEAGPEAIMPLKRGADGSLGVQMHGSNSSQSKPVNNSVAVNNNYTIAGAISEETVVARIKQAGEQTKSDVKQSVVGWLNQYSQDGALV